MTAIREEIEKLNRKLSELTDEELKRVTGGDGLETGKGGRLGLWGVLVSDDGKENVPGNSLSVPKKLAHPRERKSESVSA